MPGSSGQMTQAWFAWVGEKSKVGTWDRTNVTSLLGMGDYRNTGAAQNDELVYPLYLDSVTWKWAVTHDKASNRGIMSFIWDGSTWGTIDFYDAAGASNFYSEVTGITLTAPKAGDATFRMATKNASSTGFLALPNSFALIRTGGTASTPAGTDTPGYTWEHVWWMGYKGVTGPIVRIQGSGHFSGGFFNVTDAINNEANVDFWQDTGSFTYAQIHSKDVNRGIYTVNLDGVAQGTIDGFVSPGPEQNAFNTITTTMATAGVKNFQLKVAAKNASSTGYDWDVNTSKWLRTGA